MNRRRHRISFTAMPRKRRRSPVLAAFLGVLMLGLMIRSLWARDVVAWHSVVDHRDSIIQTSIGMESAWLGLGIFHEETLITLRPTRGVPASLTSIDPGLHFETHELPETSSLIRRVGFGFERHVDERPESFRNSTRLIVPLWLIAAVLAIGPMRWWIARRAAKRAAPVESAGGEDMMRPERSTMKITAIAVLCGVLIGGMLVYSFLGDGSSAATKPSTAPAISDEGPPIHPIVGSWRIRMDPIRATYRFGNDGSFLLSFKGVPARRDASPPEAGGSWRVDDDKLVMLNKWSNTPLSIVGEEETATITSVTPENLALSHLNGKGEQETLTLARVHPFVKGKRDDPRIVGQWKSSRYTLDLQADGAAVRTSRSQTMGEWCQQGATLTLLMNPPEVRSAARRQADPSLSEPREEEHLILQLDEQRLVLRSAELLTAPHLVFERVLGTPAEPRGAK